MDEHSIINKIMEISQNQFNVGFLDVIWTICGSFTMGMLIAYLYKKTYVGDQYSQNFAHTLIILSMITTSIMLIIGSNITSSFVLIGTLSIVRFRNSIKDTQDIGYIFFSIAIGLGFGNRYYMITIVSGLLICAAIFILKKINFANFEDRNEIINLRIPKDNHLNNDILTLFKKNYSRVSLINKNNFNDNTDQLSLYVTVKNKNHDNNLKEQLKKLDKRILFSSVQKNDFFEYYDH